MSENRKTLKTSSRGAPFGYEGSVAKGTIIYYGEKWSAEVTKDQYTEILKVFKGKTVNKGTSHTNPPEGSFGDWLKTSISLTGLSSYICAILVSEGYADVEKSDIRFKGE